MATFDFIFPVQPVQRPDGSLNEDRMLANVMEVVVNLNADLGFVHEEDTLLGIMFAEDGGAVEAVVRFETKRDIDFTSKHLEGENVYISVHEDGRQ